jgi:hypothetical protein
VPGRCDSRVAPKVWCCPAGGGGQRGGGERGPAVGPMGRWAGARERARGDAHAVSKEHDVSKQRAGPARARDGAARRTRRDGAAAVHVGAHVAAAAAQVQVAEFKVRHRPCGERRGACWNVKASRAFMGARPRACAPTPTAPCANIAAREPRTVAPAGAVHALPRRRRRQRLRRHVAVRAAEPAHAAGRRNVHRRERRRDRRKRPERRRRRHGAAAVAAAAGVRARRVGGAGERVAERRGGRGAGRDVHV